MGFFDFLEKVSNGLNNFATSESVQNLMSKTAENAMRQAEQAEKDYDAGRISLDQYMAKIDNASKVVGNYMDYQTQLERMKNKK